MARRWPDGGQRVPDRKLRCFRAVPRATAGAGAPGAGGAQRCAPRLPCDGLTKCDANTICRDRTLGVSPCSHMTMTQRLNQRVSPLPRSLMMRDLTAARIVFHDMVVFYTTRVSLTVDQVNGMARATGWESMRLGGRALLVCSMIHSLASLDAGFTEIPFPTRPKPSSRPISVLMELVEPAPFGDGFGPPRAG